MYLTGCVLTCGKGLFPLNEIKKGVGKQVYVLHTTRVITDIAKSKVYFSKHLQIVFQCPAGPQMLAHWLDGQTRRFIHCIDNALYTSCSLELKAKIHRPPDAQEHCQQ